MSVKWITLALQSITRKHRDLRQISVDVPYDLTRTPLSRDVWGTVEDDISETVGKGIFEEWLDLDRVLTHFLESLSVCPNVVWTKGKRDDVVGDRIGCLLPEMMKRGLITVKLAERRVFV